MLIVLFAQKISMKNLSVIVDDNTICIDGKCIELKNNINLGLENNIHAIQWDEIAKKGHVEYKEKIPNKIISDIEKYKFLINLYYNEIKLRQELKEKEAKEIELNTDWESIFKNIRSGKLYESDWTQLPDVNLTESEKESWKIYRQQLRDLPDSITDYKLMVNEPNNEYWPQPPI